MTTKNRHIIATVVDWIWGFEMIGSPIKDFYRKVQRHFTVLYNPNSDNIIIMPDPNDIIQGETFDIKYDEMVEIINNIKKTWKEKKEPDLK